MYAGLEYGMGKARGGKHDWVRDGFLLGAMHFYCRCDPQYLNLNDMFWSSAEECRSWRCVDRGHTVSLRR
jgi:hypothetical protein